VIFKVSRQELEAFDNHESGYKRERIDQKNIAMLDGSKSAPEGDIWFYAVTEKRFASPEFPNTEGSRGRDVLEYRDRASELEEGRSEVGDGA